MSVAENAGIAYMLPERDIISIQALDEMSNWKMQKIADKWNPYNTYVRVNDILFDNGEPSAFIQFRFYSSDVPKDDFVEFMMGMSLTHRAMFVESDGGIFVTRASDGKTNIDANLLDSLSKAFDEPEWAKG